VKRGRGRPKKKAPVKAGKKIVIKDEASLIEAAGYGDNEE
jgi:hypothetical protein